MCIKINLQEPLSGLFDKIYIEKLKGLSPLDKLNQGFSYVSDEEGRTVTDVTKVHIGDRLQIYVKNGKLSAAVTGKE